jgi:MFS family permease
MRVRNVVILSISQAVGMAGITMVILLGGILGADLAPRPAWETLPIALMVVGVALFAIPAALLMRRIGRRRGFLLGAAVAGLASLLAAYAVARGSFPLLCASTLFLGVNTAFVQQYRFAATENAEPRLAGRAVSFVLLGGILAGYFGPLLAQRTRDWLPMGAYTGSFASLAILYAGVVVLMLFFRDGALQPVEVAGGERPLGEIARQPLYRTAVLAGAVAYGVMTFVMTATPIHLHKLHGYTLQQTSLVIQSHIVAMYLPSLFTGLLLERLGVLRVMVAGLASMVAAALLGALSHDLPLYWAALVLLGLGWNLLFVGATVLLTRSYLPAERFKAQAANDFAIFGVQATAALLAGTVLFYTNWQILNLAVMPILALTLAAVVLLRRQMAPAPAAA